MTVFEPLFLLLALATLVALVGAALAAARGRFAAARTILVRVVIGAALYFSVVAVVSLASPRREYRIGDEQTFDDWSIAVTDAQRTEFGGVARYDVTLRLSSHARGAPQRERGTVVYLLDAHGDRYDPLPSALETPLDVLLQPGESVLAQRRFELPAGATDVGLVYTLEGGFPIQWFVIGEGGWFARKPVVLLASP